MKMDQKSLDYISKIEVYKLNRGSEDSEMAWRDGYLYACKYLAKQKEDCEDALDFIDRVDDMINESSRLDSFGDIF